MSALLERIDRFELDLERMDTGCARCGGGSWSRGPRRSLPPRSVVRPRTIRRDFRRTKGSWPRYGQAAAGLAAVGAGIAGGAMSFVAVGGLLLVGGFFVQRLGERETAGT